MPHRIATEDLIADLKRVTNLLDHTPSYEDMREHGEYHPHTFQRRFGPWTEVKRLAGWIPPWENFEPAEVSPEDGYWLAGLIDGEGCFRIQAPSATSGDGLSRSYACVFTISLRDDDIAMLDELVRILDLTDVSMHIDNRAGNIASGMTGANPAVKINLRDVPTLAFHLIPLLKRNPLRSKKKYELVVFDFAVQLLLKKRQEGRLNLSYTDEERELLDSCYHALSEMKEYQADYQDIVDRYSIPVELPSF